MAELRWNPLLRTWTMVASSRQDRPHLPADWCPFCPGSGRVPDHYDVYDYPNDFPVLETDPDRPSAPVGGPYRAMESYGRCEVILYSPDHQARLHQLSVDHIVRLVELWTDRTRQLAADPRIKYVFPFENRGEEVGVTMPHPHGQLYAYPFVPLKLEVELLSCRRAFEEQGECLLCRMNAEEAALGRRVIAENESFLCYLPFFTDYPYGAFIVSKEHILDLTGFKAGQQRDLAWMLKHLVGAFDALFDRPFPYMMAVHQGPMNSPEYAGCERYFHFHIEFYPPLRARDKIKFYASSEMGAWAAANVRNVEDTAGELRDAWRRFASRDAGARR